MGLRVSEGVAIGHITELGFALNAGKLAEYEGLGLITNANGRLALTRGGRLMADRIAADLSP